MPPSSRTHEGNDRSFRSATKARASPTIRLQLVCARLCGRTAGRRYSKCYFDSHAYMLLFCKHTRMNLHTRSRVRRAYLSKGTANMHLQNRGPKGTSSGFANRAYRSPYKHSRVHRAQRAGARLAVREIELYNPTRFSAQTLAVRRADEARWHVKLYESASGNCRAR